MHREDARVVPDDACLFDRDTGDVRALLPEMAAGLVADIIERNRAIAVRERSLVVRRAFRGTTESQGEQGQVDAEITMAGDELRALRGERDRALETLRRAINGPVRLVESGTYATQIREMIAAAKRDLLMIAPWISQSALGDATYKELGNTARRLDRLVIGYDVGRKRGGDQDRLEAQSLQLKRRIREQSRWDPDKLAAGDNVPPSVRIEDIPYAGPTVIICDDSRVLLAPFNPFVMNLATALPAPAAILFEDKATVRALAEGAERILGTGRGDRVAPTVRS